MTIPDGNFNNLFVLGRSDLGGSIDTSGDLRVGRDPSQGITANLSVTGSSTLHGPLTVAASQPTDLGGSVHIRGPLTVDSGQSTTLGGELSVTGDVTVSGSVDGRDVAADGASLDQHLARTDNPHSVAAAQVGALAAGGGSITGDLTVAGNVGIGTTSPDARLHIEGGSDATLSRSGFLVLGSTSGLNLTIDNNEILVRNNGQESNLLLQANGGDLTVHSQQRGTEFVVKDNGNVGIGTSGPDRKLHVVGNRIRLQQANRILDMRADGRAVDLESDNVDLFINNNGRATRIRNLVNISSREIKENIHALSNQEALQTLKDLRPVSFNFTSDQAREIQFGFIAEESPTTVTTMDKQGIRPLNIIAVLTRVVQEQQATIAQLSEQLQRNIL